MNDLTLLAASEVILLVLVMATVDALMQPAPRSWTRRLFWVWLLSPLHVLAYHLADRCAPAVTLASVIVQVLLITNAVLVLAFTVHYSNEMDAS